ncbi:MAG: primase-helicase zinc-binding domain-containing protein [Pirellulaceae bacterium]
MTPATKSRPRKIDKDQVKAAAVGRMLEILEQVANIPHEYLTDQEGPCPWCGGDTRFRVVDPEAGAVFCSHCHSTKNGDFLSAIQKGRGVAFPEALHLAGEFLGISVNWNGHATETETVEDAITLIARAKNIPTKDAVLAYGAVAIANVAVNLPAYGPDGKRCTSFVVGVNGTDTQRKGKFSKGKPAGLFFPHEGGEVRLPRPGETWHMVEGFKDAATLHHLGYLAVGLNTSSMNIKFASLFAGVDVVLVPDRDQAGEEGAGKTTARLHGHASSVLMAVLPAEFAISDGKDVRDILQMKDGEQLIRQAIANAQPAELPDTSTVIVGLDEAKVAREVLAALGNLGWDDDSNSGSRIYQRVGQLVHVTENVDGTLCGVELPDNTLRIRPLPPPIIRERIASAVTLEGPSDKDGDVTYLRPPGWLVNAIHQRGEYPRAIRPLSGIVRCPTLRPDGTVVQQPGYDERTGLLFAPDGQYPPISEEPTKGDAVSAAAQLLDIVADFPFKGPEHRSVWLAMTLTLVGRSAISGPCPMFAIDANCPGTGKSMLSDVAGLIAYGERLPRKSWPGDDDNEVRKTITSVALESLPAVLWDNIGDALGCSSLDAALTGTTWTDRILGSNATTGVLPLTTVWAATGNNLVLGADTARRVLYCRIETDLDNPEERDGFHHDNLIGWVRQHRHQLAVDAVTVLRAYAHAGYPSQKLTTWGSYEAWSNLIRNAIAWVGLPDPWGTRSIVREADRSVEVLGLIHDGITEADQDGDGVTSGQIVRLVSAPVEAGKADTHPLLRAAITEICGTKIDGRKVGNQLRQYIGRVKAGRRLCRDNAHGGVGKWSVKSVNRGGSGGCGGSAGCPSHFSNSLSSSLSSDLNNSNSRAREGQGTDPPHQPHQPSGVCPDCSHHLVETITFDGYINTQCLGCGRIFPTRKEAP